MSNVGTSGKKTRGRQKIVMQKMTNQSNLQVTFSKRRMSLFKKASELCTLSGAEVALIVFSHSGKVFSFGHPNVEVVIQRYFSQAPHQTSIAMLFAKAHQRDSVRELNAQLSDINNQIDAECKYEEELNRLVKAAHARFGRAYHVEEMDVPQLEKLRTELNEFKKCVTRYVSTATNPTTHQSFDVVGVPTTTSMVPVNQPSPLPPQAFPEE